jgi:hypothetical protein
VLIRTFLGWSLAVEIDGRWPWQVRPEKDVTGKPAGGTAGTCERAWKSDRKEALP